MSTTSNPPGPTRSTVGRELVRLRSCVRGDVTGPDDDGYDRRRRVWNGMIDRRPLAIVECEGSADVIEAVDAARRLDVPVSVRSGGHSVAGRSVVEGGLVIDLGRIRHVVVDRRRRLARVGVGARWADVDRETTPFGLATTGGVHSGTGVGGLALGGGVGYLARSFGLTVDNIVAAEVVLADGRAVTVDATRHADLFWALRGGGGNLGIVTELTLRLHEIGPLVGTTQAWFSVDRMGEVLRWYRDFQVAAPPEVGVLVATILAPPIELFPDEVHGSPVVGLVGVAVGDQTDDDALDPIAALPGSVAGFSSDIEYAALQSMFDAGSPDGARYYWKSHYLADLTDEAIDAIVNHVLPLPGPFTNLFIEPMGGAIADVASDATAYPHRSARFGIGFAAGWSDRADDETAIEWARTLHRATAAASTGGVYGNYLDRDDGDQVAAAYLGNLGRLQRVKAVYDPDDLFAANGLIRPRATAID